MVSRGRKILNASLLAGVVSVCISALLGPLDSLALVIASVCHDVGHAGKDSAYHVRAVHAAGS